MRKGLLAILLLLVVTHARAVTLDLLVIYPQAVQNSYNTSGKISQLISWANQAFANSSTSISLRLVHHRVVNLPGDHEVSTGLLSTLVYNSAIMNLRNTYRPDLTVYLTFASTEWCGWAYFPDPDVNPRTGAFVRRREMAFKGVSVVGVNCDEATFAHEIGHNLGAGHGRRQGDNGYPIATNRGWGVDQVFRTIMPYYEAYNAPRVQYFSNPNVSGCAGLACGTSIDNAATGMTSIVSSYVAAYSSCYPSRTVSSHGATTYMCGYNVCLKPAPRGGCAEWE